MIRYSSSVHKSDWECSSKSVQGSLFVNPLYIKNLTNLTNLTTLQTLQPYRQCVDTFLFCAACTGGEASFRATCTGFKLEKWHFPTTEGLVPLGPEPIRDMAWKPCELSKIKRTHRSRSFWSPRRRSQASLAFTRCGHHSLLPRMLMTFRRCCIAAAMDSTASSNCRMVGIDWPARAPSLLRSRSIR